MEQGNKKQSWEGSVEGSVKMLCGYMASKDNARTQQRAKDMDGLFTDELKRLFFLIRSIEAAAYARGRADEAAQRDKEDKKIVAAAVERTLKRLNPVEIAERIVIEYANITGREADYRYFVREAAYKVLKSVLTPPSQSTS